MIMMVIVIVLVVGVKQDHSTRTDHSTQEPARQESTETQGRAKLVSCVNVTQMCTDRARERNSVHHGESLGSLNLWQHS